MAKIVHKPRSMAMVWAKDESQHVIVAIVVNTANEPRSMWHWMKKKMRLVSKEDGFPQ